MDEIVDNCKTCPAKHILLIFDCCYSGYLEARESTNNFPKKIDEQYLKDINSRRAIQIIAASQKDQTISDSGVRLGHSAFTGALLDLLESYADPNHDGILTAKEIGYIIEDKVSEQTKGDAYQRPLYSGLPGSNTGDFIFNIWDAYKDND
jgi:hypothetical protein